MLFHAARWWLAACFVLLAWPIVSAQENQEIKDAEKKEAAEGEQPLPLKRVVLFSSSVGFFEHGGSVEGKPYPHARNIVYRNNTFEKGRTGKCGTWGPITSFDDTAPGNIWTGNVWTDGTRVLPSN